MHALAARELLEVWERGADQAPVEQALALLAGACPETPGEELAGLSIGRRDALLLELREGTFGPDLVSVASCPACGARLETAFRAADIRAEPKAGAAGPLELTGDGWTVRFRLPNSLDLAALSALDAAGEAAGRELLLGQCVLSAELGGRPAAAADLPEEVVRAVAERMERSDPQADVRIALGCPACGHRWEPVFDILSFFWTEITAWAERTLREVHLLASAYGWREAEVLALGPRRRQAYLRMVAG
ncbi:MAG TPA: phage baseplate protein [Thermoanaerobaculia bacterium]|nr:phage baseplate protein [Thermoanaerobaculia bacterium]